jgi:hypothetical protein
MFMFKNILGKVSGGFGKLTAFVAMSLLAVQSFAQTGSLTLPANTETMLTAIISDNFGTVVAVVVLVVGAGLLIRLIKKAG